MASNRHKRSLAQAQRSAPDTQQFSADDLFGPSAVQMETTIERLSNNKKRRVVETVPVNPPSPMKRQTAASSSRLEVPSVVEDLYAMDLDLDTQANADEDVPLRREQRRDPVDVKPADPALHYWRDRHRDTYLRTLLWHDGRGGSGSPTCPQCLDPAHAALYRCDECMDARLLCQECCVAAHRYQPLHWIASWNGFFFVRTALKDLGLRIQFGHGGRRCVRPVAGHRDFVVIHRNGVHEVAVDFCGCEQQEEEFLQLLRGRWFPATSGRPQTCATFDCVNLFDCLSHEANTSARRFYTVLELLTNGAGRKPPNRYPAFLRIMREWRHLHLLKRRGRLGHEGSKAADTNIGELALRCPVCPRPGVNLPDDWEHALPEDQCLYIDYTGLDACFRLKRRMVSSERRDPPLGPGFAFMVEPAPYRAWLLTQTDQKEMSTCSGLAALDYANTKFSRGYSATGVGMGVCVRHELVKANGVGDLQKGERYANMDYIFASILRHMHPLLRIILSYDIACQWWKELRERLLLLPPLVRLKLVLDFIRFVIPKMHIRGHTLDCRNKYSLNYVPGSGQTDAEGIERAWAAAGGMAASTKLMGPGSRSDTLDDFWSFWNWMKVLGLAALLRRRLDTAEVELQKQQEAFELFSEEQADSVDEWKQLVLEFEADGTKKNPYESTMKGLTEAQVRLRLEEEEEEAATEQTRPPIHDIGPVAFVITGLEVEEEQRRVRAQVALKKAKSPAQKGKLRSLRRKLSRSIRHWRSLQATYTPAALVQLETLSLPENVLPENIPLLLPSTLAAVTGTERSEAFLELLGIERQLRDAQCRTALMQLETNCTSRPASTSRDRLHSEKYQVAWLALLLIAGGIEADVGWNKLEKADIRCMQEAETFTRNALMREQRERRRRERIARLVAEGEQMPVDEGTSAMEVDGEDARNVEEFTEGTNRNVMSWIWHTTGSGGTDAEMHEALQIEWCKAWARVRRWNEEVRILKEEFRRLPVSFEYEAEEWRKRAVAVPLDSVPVGEGEGMLAYALRQASMYHALALQAEVTRTEERLGRGYRRRRYYQAELGFAPELGTGDGEEGAEGEDSDVDSDREDLDSDEELLVGGELDDD
ncbi:CxC2 domain-containing protein [Mycena chlorophos]|uniref:CxC2 domain-containing protein n=1 Tax=Mycena chlorophos TaxID=658473 RepID=A0A8H6SUZ5_MYCCL|nr:CxC2 domain-containing protein [Mycena chlorophos]